MHGCLSVWIIGWKCSLSEVLSFCVISFASFYSFFNVEKSCTVDDLKDIIKSEIYFYRMETISDSMFLMKQGEGKDRHKQSSYWKYAYQNIAGIEEVSQEEDKFRRIDSYWNDISRIQDESTGKLKYEKLSKLALGIFVIPIANPAPERGFSINKIMLQIHGSSLDDETIVAIRFVKDHIIKCGGNEC